MKREKKIYVIVRNDDICALSDPVKERKIMELFESYNIPQIISVIPHVAEDINNAYLNKYYALEKNSKIVSLLKEYLAKMKSIYDQLKFCCYCLLHDNILLIIIHISSSQLDLPSTPE